MLQNGPNQAPKDSSDAFEKIQAAVLEALRNSPDSIESDRLKKSGIESSQPVASSETSTSQLNTDVTNPFGEAIKLKEERLKQLTQSDPKKEEPGSDLKDFNIEKFAAKFAEEALQKIASKKNVITQINPPQLPVPEFFYRDASLNSHYSGTAIPSNDIGVELQIGGTPFSYVQTNFLTKIKTAYIKAITSFKHALMRIGNKVLGAFIETQNNEPIFKIPEEEVEKITLTRPSIDVINMLGQGGEAKVYRVEIKNKLKGLKVFREPWDEQYKTEESRLTAAKRLPEYANRLAEFPKLPGCIVAPEHIAYDRGGKLIGYSMNLIKNSISLAALMTPSDQAEHNITHNDLMQIFLEVHDALVQLHKNGVIIGDLRPENILISSGAIYIVDAESMQYGKWKCHNFTPGWVDPLLCELKDDGKSVVKTQPHNEAGDWYAFSVMLFEALTGVSPYGGTLIEKGKIVPEFERPYSQKSVFNEKVIVPPFALPLDNLSPELRKFFENTFDKKKQRGVFPRKLLEETVWTQCTNCKTEFCGAKCSTCGSKSKVSIPEKLESLNFKLNQLQIPAGQEILRFNHVGDKPSYLAFDSNLKSVVHSDNWEVGSMNDPSGYQKYIMLAKNTGLVAGNVCCIIKENGTNNRIAQIDSGLFGETAVDGNDDWLYYIKNRHLFRFKIDELNNENVTPRELPIELDNRDASLWIGSKKGLLLADDADRPLQVYILDGLSQKQVKKFPDINGKIIAADTSFSEHVAWLSLETEEYGRRLKYIFAIDVETRELRAWHKGSELYTPTWLEQIEGKVAYEDQNGSFLLCPTEAGIIRLKLVSNRIMEAGIDTKIRLDPDAIFYAHNSEITVVNDAASEIEAPSAPAVVETQQPLTETSLNTPFSETFTFNPNAFLEAVHNKNQEINSNFNKS